MLGSLLLARMGAVTSQSSHWGLRLVALLVALSVYHLLNEELDFAENAQLQILVAGVAGLSLLVFAVVAIRKARALSAS